MDHAERARVAWVNCREAIPLEWGQPGDLISRLIRVVDELDRGEVVDLAATVGRLVDDDPGTVLLYAIGQSRACCATVPLAPRVTGSAKLRAALEYEVSTDHECLGRPPVGMPT